MFPIPWNFPFRKKDGSLGTMEDLGGQYTLPTASADIKGGVKIGSGLTMDGEVLKVDGSIGGSSLYVGMVSPSNSLGNNGDIYIKYAAPLVPILSGVSASVIYSSQMDADGPAWKLFDGKDDTFWSSALYSSTNQYCGYDFGEGNSVLVNRIGINPRAFNGVVQCHDFKVQGSNDGEIWTDIYSGTIANVVSNAGKMNYFEFDNDDEYRYLRLFVVDANTSQTVTIFETQFYGEGDAYDHFDIIAKYMKLSDAWYQLM